MSITVSFGLGDAMTTQESGNEEREMLVYSHPSSRIVIQADHTRGIEQSHRQNQPR